MNSTAPQRSEIERLLDQTNYRRRFEEMLGARAPQYISSIITVYKGFSQPVEPSSVIAAAAIAATLDLPIEKNLGFAHIVPYGNVAQFQMGYKGFIQLALRSGQYKSLNAQPINKEALKGYDEIGDPIIDWAKLDTTQEPIGYAFAWKLVSGFTKTIYWSKEKIRAHAERYSQAYRKKKTDSPWFTSFDQMSLKGLALDTPIPTPNGWSTMGALEVGDLVFDMHGHPVPVSAVSAVKHLDCFQFTLSNGERIICDNEHFWFAATSPNASRTVKGWPVRDAQRLFEDKSNGLAVTVPLCEPIVLPYAPLPIDPWLLGYWLGNGNKHNAVVSCHGADADEVQERIVRAGYTVGSVRKDPRSNCVRVTITKGLRIALRSLGVLLNKHVPQIYMRASIHQRYELLKGLMDSDGHIDRARGRATFSNTNVILSDAVFELATSLGEAVARCSYQAEGYGKTAICHAVYWKPRIAPMSLARKVANFTERKVVAYRSVSTIERIDSVATRCIAVDSPTRSYLAGRSMVPTHNTVIKDGLNHWGILSVQLQKAMVFDQTTMKDLDAEPVAIDNPRILPASSPDLGDSASSMGKAEADRGDEAAEAAAGLAPVVARASSPVSPSGVPPVKPRRARKPSQTADAEEVEQLPPPPPPPPPEPEPIKPIDIKSGETHVIMLQLARGIVDADIQEEDLMNFCKREGMASAAQYQLGQLATKKLITLCERWPDVIEDIRKHANPIPS